MRPGTKRAFAAFALTTLAAPLLAGCGKQETSEPTARNESSEVKTQRAEKDGGK